MGWSESHSHPWHVDIRVGMCIFLLECVCVCHCMSTYVGSNPYRRLSSTGLCSPRYGIPLLSIGPVQAANRHMGPHLG